MKKGESKLQREIRKTLEYEVGGFWWKVHGGPFQRVGIPDLLGCVMGIYIAIEVKVPGGRTSPIQKSTMRLIRKAGGLAFVSKDPLHAVDRVKRRLKQGGKTIKKRCPRKDRKIIHGAGNWQDQIHKRRKKSRSVPVSNRSKR